MAQKMKVHRGRRGTLEYPAGYKTYSAYKDHVARELRTVLNMLEHATARNRAHRAHLVEVVRARVQNIQAIG